MKLHATLIALMFGALLQPCLGQANWEKLTSGTPGGFKGVHFQNDKKGYAAGDEGFQPMIRATTDGGKTWRALDVIGQNASLWGVYATSGSSGDIIYGAGDNGMLMKSTDGGANWVMQDLKYSEGFTFGISGFNSNIVCVTGGEGGFAGATGVIVTTTDGGANWKKTSIAGSYAFDKSIWTSATTAYAAGSTAGFDDGLIYKTTDAGETWKEIGKVTGGLNSIHSFDENNLIAVGFDATVVRTTDGGKNWTRVAIPGAASKDAFTHVTFLDEWTGYITSSGGQIYKSVDGGLSWKRDETFNNGATVMWTMSGVRIGDQGTVWAVGDGGSIFRVKTTLKAPAPTAELGATNLFFGKLATGTSDRTVTIAAANLMGLRIDSLYIQDGAASGFSVVEPQGPFPINVQMGNPVTVKVRFTATPGATNDAMSKLVIKTNDAENPELTVDLLAEQGEDTGNQPPLVLNSTKLEFGKVTQNGTKDLTITLTANKPNLKVEALSIENEAIPGTFTLVSPTSLPATVQVGNPLQIVVRFKPQMVSQESADLYIETNAATNSEFHVTLEGEGVKPVGAGVGGSNESSGLRIAATPNPIVASGAVQVSIPAPARLRVALHDLLGNEAMLLFDGASEAGTRSFAIDATRLPAGVYYCVVRSADKTAVEQLTIAR